MPEEGFKRKLVAILSADAVEYSRLMRDDEESTVRELAAHRLLLNEIVNQHDGRVIDSPGDNMLAEFASVVDAVNGAVKIQEALRLKNADIPPKRRLAFRIGINLGDVICEGDRIYGDGVNIAARLEGLAAAGGIAISGTVYEQIKNKISLNYQYSGEHSVKNFSEPIEVYQILPEPKTSSNVIAERRSGSKRSYRVAEIFAVLVMCAAAAVIWTQMRSTVFNKEKAATTNGPLPLSKRASIAVLPFNNLSGDPKQAYFSDGITNDIITFLSRFGELLVIASNTTFTYKGKPVNVERVGQELDVRYVLEGSARKAGTKVRVSAQLVDAGSGFQIWSERYDRELKDIFLVQDQIVQTIVGKLAVKIDAAERKRVMHKDTKSLEAYDFLLRGMEYRRRATCSDFRKARQMYQKAIDLDPGFASAYAGLGRVYQAQTSYGCTEFPDQALEQAKDLALKALNLDESQSDAYALLGTVYSFRGRYELAINQLNRAIELNPNDSLSLSYRGQVMIWSGRVNDGIHSLETAVRFDPNRSPGNFMFLGIGYYLQEQYQKAIKVLEDGVSRRPAWVGNHLILAAAYAQSDRLDDAKREAREVLRLDPFFEIDSYGSVFRNQADRAKIVEGLRLAGL